MSCSYRNGRIRHAGGMLVAAVICWTGWSVGPATGQSASVDSRFAPALERVSADSLRGHLSFIASDLLEGRGTPSRGLDLAAEYIAAQFRRAGLEPVGDDGYFQTAKWFTIDGEVERFELSIRSGDRTIRVERESVVGSLDQTIDLTDVAVVKVEFDDDEALKALTADEVAGRAVITAAPTPSRADRREFRQAIRARQRFSGKMRKLGAVVVLSVGGGTGQARPGRLIDPENRRERTPRMPLLTVRASAAREFFDSAPSGATSATVSVHVEPRETPVRLRNVVGILRGSDPLLRDTFVLVTAHYDHVGVRGTGEGDHIYNGANDDGSGTVTVVELAAALAALEQRPKRSIVFMTFFGEERGLLGSRYYGRHPIFPIEKTVANINLEQVGRTDSTEGPQLNNASVTGFDFSDIGAIFKKAGEQTGIKVYKHMIYSDAFFGASDNRALADLGVPAHTICVAYHYADYHGAGDHWDKIDYDNMARVVRMIALGLLTIADDPDEPRWNEDNSRARRYLDAWKKRREP